jgi:hypothetical protein
MLINAYDTTSGTPFKTTDRVESTIKTLHMMKDLIPTTKEGVFVVSYSSAYEVPIFAFPITMETFDRKTITVFDERPFRNKSSNAVVNQNEIVILRLAAFLQQDAFNGNVTPLKAARLQCAKAFAEALGMKVGRSAILDANETLTLKVLLAYYYVGLIEQDADELELVAMNVIRTIYGCEKGFILGVVDGVGQMKTLNDLLQGIQTNPTLYKLKNLTLADFISVVMGISFSAMKGKIIAAAAEAPCLFTALVYGAATFKAYSKTPLGMALDPKYNKNSLESFIKNIHYTYNLNG